MFAAARRQQHEVADVHVGPPLDLASLDSVRRFAAAWDAEGRPLHILVNNAGANYVKEAYTADGVAILAQVRVLGPCCSQQLLQACALLSAMARVLRPSSAMYVGRSTTWGPTLLRDALSARSSAALQPAL